MFGVFGMKKKEKKENNNEVFYYLSFIFTFSHDKLPNLSTLQNMINNFVNNFKFKILFDNVK